MIKFIRKIRQELLTENKFSKYLLYAIGEIVLVVIGILIALSINNWNENRKDRKEELVILNSLENDFLTSQSEIELVVKQQNKAVEKTAKFINLFETYKAVNNKDSFIESNKDSIVKYLKAGIYGWFREEPITGSYDALIGSGKTELIRNQELKKKLAEYSTIVKTGFEDQETSMNILNLLIDKQSVYVGSGSLWKFGKRQPIFLLDDDTREYNAIKKLLVDYSYEGTLIAKYGIENIRLKMQRKLLEFTIKILEMIKTEIINFEE